MASVAAGKQVSLSVSAAAVTMREDAAPSSGGVAGAAAESSSRNGARPVAKAGAVKKVSLAFGWLLYKLAMLRVVTATCVSFACTCAASTREIPAEAGDNTFQIQHPHKPCMPVAAEERQDSAVGEGNAQELWRQGSCMRGAGQGGSER